MENTLLSYHQLCIPASKNDKTLLLITMTKTQQDTEPRETSEDIDSKMAHCQRSRRAISQTKPHRAQPRVQRLRKHHTHAKTKSDIVRKFDLPQSERET